MYKCPKCGFEWHTHGTCPCGETFVFEAVTVKKEPRKIEPCPFCGSNRFEFLPDDDIHGMHDGNINCPVNGAIFSIDEWNIRV